MGKVNYLSDSEIKEMKLQLKGKTLKKDEINDIVFTEALSRLTIEDRLRVLGACMFNDSFRRSKYRKSSK